MSPPPTPAPDAVWIGLSSRRLLVLTYVIACVPLGLGLATVWGMLQGAPVSTLIVWGVFAALFLGAGIGLLRAAIFNTRRRAHLGFDRYGVWWRGPGPIAVVPWDEVAAARTCTLKHPYEMPGSARYTHRVEVFVHKVPDPEHPVFRHYLRQGESPRPDLPHPYLQACLPNFSSTGSRRRTGASKRAEAAIRRWRPQVWVGHDSRGATEDDHVTLLNNDDHVNPRKPQGD